MEFHIHCDPKDIAQFVLCSGDVQRARLIADHLDKSYVVSDSRGYFVYSGFYKEIFISVCGTGIGGPTTAIALEELAHMGANTFIRVGSCGVLQQGQEPGDVIIASGSVREGGTGNAYLPLNYPAVSSFSVLRSLVEAAESLGIEYSVGIGISSDAFYAPTSHETIKMWKKTGLLFVEMESDTFFTVGLFRRWETGAVFASDGTPDEIKPEWGKSMFYQGEENIIKIALHGIEKLVQHSDSH